MEASSPLRGLIVDLITPFKASGDIDHESLARHLKRILPYVQGVYLASPYGGEGENLTSHQRAELLQIAIDHIREQVPILIWMSQKTEAESQETLHLFVKRLEEERYRGQVFWVDTPLFYHSNRGLPLHYQQIATIAKGPFLLHNDPEFIKSRSRPLKRNNIRTSILKELVRVKHLQGLIFLGSLDRARNYQKAVRSRSDFRIYDGDESQFLQYPSVNGVISIGANLAPGAWQKVTHSSLNIKNHQKDYPDHLQQIWELGAYLQDLKELCREDPVPLVKQVLADMSILESPYSTKKCEILPEKVENLKGLMKQYGDY